MQSAVTMRSDIGTYALLLHADAEHQIEVGALGRMEVRPGTYVYVGSAFGPGGVQARVERHAQDGGTLHWHVDYLRKVTTLGDVWYTHDPVHRECTWAAVVREQSTARVPIVGFGASDCGCTAHLVFVEERPAFATFRTRVQDRCPDHAAIAHIDGTVPTA